MTEHTARRDPDRCPSHPGAMLSDMLLDLRISKVEVAKRLGISRQQLHDILAERKSLSPTVAAKVGRLFGGGTAFWVRIQGNYDAWHADHTIDLSGITPLAA
jgi:antitoxin HigA-1